MVKMFRANETDFTHNEWVLNEIISITIVEDLEGIFDLTMEYPLHDKKGLSQYIVRGNIIESPVHGTRGDQLFKIRTATPNTNTKRIKVYAQCIARTDLMTNFVPGIRVLAGQTRKQAINTILNNCAENQGYYVGNLDTNANTSINLGIDADTGNVINYLDIDAVSPLEGLIGTNKSVKLAYGGEIIYNNKEINIVDERGIDNSFEIRSGKNLQELEQEISDLDTENFATALTMQTADGLYLPNQEIIYSPKGKIFDRWFYKKIVCDDVTLVDESQAAINIAYAQLRERAAKQFANGIDTLKITNTVNFIQLANTEEYKDYVQLEKCELGNNVTIKYYNIKIDGTKDKFLETTGRVVKITFNPLANNGKGKIEEVEIGERKKKSIVDTITAATNNVTTVNDKTNKNTDKIKKARKEAKTYTDSTKETLVRFIGETEDGILIEVRRADSDLGARIDVTEDEIELRVKSSEFGSLIEQHANSIVNAIEGVTNNKTTLDSSGFHVSGGAFDFSGYHGEELITAIADGSITAIRIGDRDWSKETAMRKVLIGGVPFEQFLNAYLIIDFNERVDARLEDHGLI